MLDTNSIIQAGQIAQTAREQISPWLPAMAVAAAWLGRELNRLADWSQNAAAKIIAHGGIIKIIIKLFWAPDATPSPGPSSVTILRRVDGRGQGEGEPIKI